MSETAQLAALVRQLTDALDDALFELDGDGDSPAYEAARDLIDHARFVTAEQSVLQFHEEETE